MKNLRLSAVAGVLLTSMALAAQAQAPAQVPPTHVNASENAYQAAGASPVGNVPMVNSLNPKAPPMTVAEFDGARKIYFERCAGCHGVLCKGATGKALTPDITVGKGTDYLKVFIAYGSPAGMPNWQTSGEMTEARLDAVAALVSAYPGVNHNYERENCYNLWFVITECDIGAVQMGIARLEAQTGLTALRLPHRPGV